MVSKIELAQRLIRMKPDEITEFLQGGHGLPAIRSLVYDIAAHALGDTHGRYVYTLGPYKFEVTRDGVVSMYYTHFVTGIPHTNQTRCIYRSMNDGTCVILQAGTWIRDLGRVFVSTAKNEEEEINDMLEQPALVR